MLPPRTLVAIVCLLAFACFACAQQGTLEGTTHISVDGGTLSYQTYFYTANCGPGGYFNQTTYTNFSFVIGGVTYPFSAQQVVAQGFVSASCPNYTEPSSLPLTLPNTNNSSVPAGECVYTFSNGNGSSDCPELVTDTLEPLYKVVSILYEPPGNNSSQGLTSGTSEGTNSSIGQSFTFSDEYTFSSGITGLYNDSVSFGFTISSLSSDAFAQTWTNAQSLTTDDNSLDPQGKNGSTGINGSDAVQHSLDEISVWLNPMITTVTYSDYSTPVCYSIGYQSIPNVSNPSPDIVTVPVAQMMPTPGSITSANPYGTSTVPNSKIVPSAYVGQDGSTYTEPGLVS